PSPAHRFIAAQRILAAILCACALSLPSFADPPKPADQFRIDYTVEVSSIEQQLFHITARIRNINQDSLDLSLPVWTPGWYTIENYFKNVLRFSVTDAGGRKLQPLMTRKQTWRVETRGISGLQVDFDYRATVLALNQAKVTSNYAFFTGTELFVEPIGHRAVPISVTFKLPEGWQIVSALKETSNPNVFSATDYDMLVDCPTEMGNFDLTRFEVEGKPHYFVSTPRGAMPADKAQKFTTMLSAVAKAQGAIFGGLPYEKYVYFYFFARPESNAGGALEHANSHVAFAGSSEPQNLIGTASHEFFHLWNVKRIRPAEMWPYDYGRENETPSLWISEGFTNYFGSKALYRADLRPRNGFISSVEQAIAGVETNPARSFISPANSSSSTWVGYDTPVAFGISYYTQGQNLGALLDLSILHDSKTRYGLDDVMRELYREYYQKGKGFTTEDFIAIVSLLAGRNYRDFFNRYVLGVEVPPYAQILGYAGYSFDVGTTTRGMLGVDLDVTDDEIKVVGMNENGPAARAGLKIGDTVLSIDGIDVRTRPQEATFRVDERVGQKVVFAIKRAGKDQNLDVEVVSRTEPSYKIKEAPNPTAEQLAVREAWLKK
ncbi:MAG TPA: PDZ domain-containing protein, partial [Blastocatellia bacterium]|nr:PDZ domain-containing protein [Blastocatellia bacterium]